MLRVGYEKCSLKEVKDQILGLWVIFFFFLVALKRDMKYRVVLFGICGLAID